MPKYSLEQDGVVKAKNQIEEFYQKGDFDEAVKLIKEFIDKYSNQKEKYVDEFCSVYHIRAKIFFYIQDISEMKKALLDLYHTDPSYQIYSGEKEFMDIANEIKSAVELEIKQNEEKVKNENIPRKFPVTLEIDDISNDVFICVDELNLDDARFFNQKKMELELEPGKHRFYYISKKEKKYIIKEYEITEKSYYHFQPDFSKGQNLEESLQSSKEKGVIEKPGSYKIKKKKFPFMLIIAGLTVGGVVALLIKQQSKKSIDLSPYFITDTPEISMKEGETAKFQVKLSQPPLSDINVIVTRQSGGDEDIWVKSGQFLLFNPFNWDSFQEVTIKAEKDTDAVDDNATIRISANGFQNKDIQVYVEDTDE